MTLTEMKTILAVLTAAYWTGRAMPEATAKIYAQRLENLDFNVAMQAVTELIDEDATGYFPSIGKILDRCSRIRFNEIQKTSLPELAATHWLRGAPWFVRLQVARQHDRVAAGFPIQEFKELGRDSLLQECSIRNVDAGDFGWWESRL